MFPIQTSALLHSCSLSLILLLRCCEAFLSQKLRKKMSVALVILSLCGTWSCYFLPSQIILFLFLRLINHENLVAHCDHLMLLNLCGLINTSSPRWCPFLQLEATFQLQHFLKNECFTKRIFKASAVSENCFLHLESFLCFTFSSFN